jgi:hypothetical protein
LRLRINVQRTHREREDDERRRKKSTHGWGGQTGVRPQA